MFIKCLTKSGQLIYVNSYHIVAIAQIYDKQSGIYSSKVEVLNSTLDLSLFERTKTVDDIIKEINNAPNNS